MILVKVSKNNDSYQISVEGHSGYDTIGRDIVCSSVSSQMILTVNLLEKLGYKFNFSSNEKIPMMMLKINNYDKTEEAILDNLIDCLKQVESSYHKYLLIK